MPSVDTLIPAALVVHALTCVATLAVARRAHWCRYAAFGGSALASVMGTLVAAHVIAAGPPSSSGLARA